MKRASVSEASRTVYCKIPESCPEYAKASPAIDAGMIPCRATTSPAVMPMTQTEKRKKQQIYFENKYKEPYDKLLTCDKI